MSISPQRATKHAIGHFMRVYLEGNGGLSGYIRSQERRRLGVGRYNRQDYLDRKLRRDLERGRLQMQLLELLADMTPCEPELQQYEREGALLLEGVSTRGYRYYARVDPERNLVIAFYSEATFLRVQAHRRERVAIFAAPLHR